MKIRLVSKAIDCAMSGKWNDAVKVNKAILSESPDDTEALNRLARAYAQLGDFDNARKTAKKVLSHDPFNMIASKSIERWKNLKRGDVVSSATTEANVFIEVPGKTKTIQLMHTGDDKVLALLEAGMKVFLDAKSHRANIVSDTGKYIGRLPDDLSAHLKNLVAEGNEYLVCIKSASTKGVHVFIKEIRRSQSVKNIPSFTQESVDFVSIKSKKH